MTKILKSKYKASRGLGVAMWGTEKDAFKRRNYAPGQHGSERKIKSSYCIHLHAKQLVKKSYGRITERQFERTFEIANSKPGNVGDNMASLLERRLDVAVYRLGMARTIFAAAQLVSHKHILVNGKVVNIRSYKVNIGDVVSIKAESEQQISAVHNAIKSRKQYLPDYWKTEGVDQTLLQTSPYKSGYCGQLVRFPIISDVPYAFEPNFPMIVEWYSR